VANKAKKEAVSTGLLFIFIISGYNVTIAIIAQAWQEFVQKQEEVVCNISGTKTLTLADRKQLEKFVNSRQALACEVKHAHILLK